MPDIALLESVNPINRSQQADQPRTRPGGATPTGSCSRMWTPARRRLLPAWSAGRPRRNAWAIC